MDIYENGVCIGHADEPGEVGPAGVAGVPGADWNDGKGGDRGPCGPDCHAKCKCRKRYDVLLISGEEYGRMMAKKMIAAMQEQGTGIHGRDFGPAGPLGMTAADAKHHLPWYVEHNMRAQRRAQRNKKV